MNTLKFFLVQSDIDLKVNTVAFDGFKISSPGTQRCENLGSLEKLVPKLAKIFWHIEDRINNCNQPANWPFSPNQSRIIQDNAAK